MAGDSDKRSVSTLLGCGCAALVALILGGVALMTFLTYRAGKRLEAMAHDPAQASAAVQEVLPYDELPAGYVAVGTLSVPFLMDVAFLRRGALRQAQGEAEGKAEGEAESKAEGAAEGQAQGAAEGGAEGQAEGASEGEAEGAAEGEAEAGTPVASGSGDEDRVVEENDFESGFLFVRVRDWMGRGNKARQWIESGESDDSPIDQQELRFDPQEVVARGELTAGGADVLWVARRGMLDVDTSGFEKEHEAVKITVGEGHHEEGLLTVLSIDCSGDDGWQRIGIWFVPDPAPETPAAELDWTGTPADPAAIESLLGHFGLCA